MTSLAGMLLGDRYRVLSSIGRGGMGTVYEAEDLRLGRRVALKVLLDELADDPTCKERFRREAHAAARIKHPNLIAVHDVSLESRPAFLVMELLAGQTVAALLAERERLDWRLAARISLDVLSALACLHGADIVHRDIKPSNVLLEPDGTVRVIDLGVAQLRTGMSYGRLTQSGAIIGSPSYMAPEQLSGEAVSPATDLWSVGVLAHQMLSGQHPFAAHDLSRLLWMIAHEAPPDLRTLAPEIPERVAVWVRDLLAKRPTERPESASHAAHALSAILEGSAAPRSAPAGDPESRTEARWDLSIGAGSLPVMARPPTVGSARDVGSVASHAASGSSHAAPESKHAGAVADPPQDRTQTLRQARSASVVAAAIALLGLVATCIVGTTLAALVRMRPAAEVGSPAADPEPGGLVLPTPLPASLPTPRDIQITHRGDDADASARLLVPTLDPVLRACVPDVGTHRLSEAIAAYVVRLNADGSPSALERQMGVASAEETACIERALMSARWPPPSGTHVALVLMMPVM